MKHLCLHTNRIKERWVNRFLLIVSSLGLSACAHVAVQSHAADQFLPSVDDAKLCRNLRNPKLCVGESCYFVVQPEVSFDEQGNRTGILVEAGEHYRITLRDESVLKDDQFWYDKTRRVGAPEGDTGEGIIKLMGFTKHNPGYNWFALMAMVKPLPTERGKRVPPDDNACRISSQNNEYIVASKGELSFYVNDTGADYFYSNNTGRVMVKIERLQVPISTVANVAENKISYSEPHFSGRKTCKE
jgi:hypothetical protein